ncbi:MAG: DUF5318 family protein [Acidimicrobiia bacterium]
MSKEAFQPKENLPHIDYALAKRSILRDYRRGLLTRLDVCDAHPELLRVATNYGHQTQRECPICAEEDVRSPLFEVSYLYGDNLRKTNGRPVIEHDQIAKADKTGKSYHRYLVEVCTKCKWNFLIRREDRN